jgi:hypothetical protein
MRSKAGLTEALDALATQDLAGLSDAELREELRALLGAVDRLQAQVGRRVVAFDGRGLNAADACRVPSPAWAAG